MARKPQKNVGIIGLGIIGSRIATVLRSKGWHVCVWNRSPLPEPNFLGSPAEVAAICDVIQIFVADGEALMGILNGFGDSLTERHTIVCNATIGREATLKAAAMVAEKGASFLDAPFTGSKLAAENGGLVYFVGGDDKVLSRVEPVLQASSKAIVKAGGIGDAATLKIATNMMVGVTVEVLAEATALVRASGIPPERLIDALEHHGVRSGITDMKLGSMIQGDFSPHFSTKHMLKDLNLALSMGEPFELKLPTTSITAERLKEIVERGDTDLDFSALMTLYSASPVVKAAPAAAVALAEPAYEPVNEPEKEPAQGESKTLEAEVVSQSSEPTPKQEEALAAEGKQSIEELASRVRKLFGR